MDAHYLQSCTHTYTIHKVFISQDLKNRLLIFYWNVQFISIFSLLSSLFSPAPLQDVHLEVVPIAGRNQEVNLTATVLPSEANLTVFYWWIGDNLQVLFGL